MSVKADIEKKISFYEFSFDDYFDYVLEEARKMKEKSPYHGFLAIRTVKKKKRTFYLL